MDRKIKKRHIVAVAAVIIIVIAVWTVIEQIRFTTPHYLDLPDDVVGITMSVNMGGTTYINISYTEPEKIAVFMELFEFLEFYRTRTDPTELIWLQLGGGADYITLTGSDGTTVEFSLYEWWKTETLYLSIDGKWYNAGSYWWYDSERQLDRLHCLVEDICPDVMPEDEWFVTWRERYGYWQEE